MLTNNGWKYQCGYDIYRKNDEVILLNDFRQHLNDRYGYFSDFEINGINQALTGIDDVALIQIQEYSDCRGLIGIKTYVKGNLLDYLFQ